MTREVVGGLRAQVYEFPLPQPETDGTLAWSATTIVVVRADCGAPGSPVGLGWTYAPAAAARIVDDVLAPVVAGLDAADITRAYTRMRQATRNTPSPGLASYAISAVDVALWDLKARLLGVPLSTLLGRVADSAPLYGSGGFTSMTDAALCRQLTAWVDGDGVTAVKIKIGADRGGRPSRDLERIAIAREAIGPGVTLMVDANGGYHTKQALRVADAFATSDVSWFEEPVSSDRLDELALLRGMTRAEVTAGEYGTTLDYFRQMCAAGAVDCLQVDASRCGGYTGLLAAAAIADAYGLQVSTHCAPHLHSHAAVALPNLRHCEWFADHVAADPQLFDGLARPERGRLPVNDTEPGHGLSLR